MENSFDMLIENMLSGSALKMELYKVGKKRPLSFAEFDEFKKMKKFERYEKYPDELIRMSIEIESEYFETEEQFESYVKNNISITGTTNYFYYL